MSGILFKINPKSREMVAQSGRWGLYETVYTMEAASTASSGEDVEVTYQKLLLPQPRDEYVSIRDASRMTGISAKELKALCDKGALKSKKVNGRWVILSSSLTEYKQNKTDKPA